jgi:D-aspartate ligase
MSTVPAVVVGFEENGLGVARALKAGGVQVLAVASRHHPATRTRTARHIPIPRWDRDSLIEGLVALGPDLEGRAPLFITKDEGVLWVSAEREALSPFYHIALPNPDTVDLLMNKARFLEHARARAWPVPKSWTVLGEQDLERVVAEVAWPVILKPFVKTTAFRRQGGQKAHKVDSEEGLRAAWAIVSVFEPQAIVQEWVPGGDDRIAFCLSYRGRDPAASADFVGRKLLQWPIDCGNTAVAAPAPERWWGPLLELTDQLWQDVGYLGLGSLEVKVSPDDELVIVEPTVGRTNFQSEIAPLNGVNLPLRMYNDLLGLPANPVEQRSEGVRLVFGTGWAKAVRKSVADGRIGWGDGLGMIAGRKRLMLARASDPGPILAAIGRRGRRLVRGALRRALSTSGRAPGR